MFLFKRKSPSKQPLDQEHLDELEAHKQKVEQAIQENKFSTDKLKVVFERNHFTVRIALAMGAKQQGVDNHGH